MLSDDEVVEIQKSRTKQTHAGKVHREKIVVTSTTGRSGVPALRKEALVMTETTWDY